MLNVLLVAAGGAAGSAARYGVGVAAARWFGPHLPIGTFLVNLTGSFLMGVLIELLTRRLGGSSELRLLLATGFLGGYTTFSSFSLDFVALYEKGEVALAFVYVAGSVLLGVAALFAGLLLVRHVT